MREAPFNGADWLTDGFLAMTDKLIISGAVPMAGIPSSRNYHHSDLSTYFCNVRFWGAEMPAAATGMGATRTS
jgi:hypothetical protein